MKFEDLSQSDLRMIRNFSIDLYTKTKISSRYEAISMSTIKCILGKGFSIKPHSETLIGDLVKALTPKKDDTKTVEEIVKLIFKYFESLEISLIKDELSPVMWRDLGDYLYLRGVTPKKPWMY